MFLEPVSSVPYFEAGWQFYTSGSRLAHSMKPVGSLFVPDGSELGPGGDEYVAQLGIRLPPSSGHIVLFLSTFVFLRI